MNKSPIIEEIRHYREEHAKACGFDLKRIHEDITHAEQELRKMGWTLVTEKARMRPPVAPISGQ